MRYNVKAAQETPIISRVKLLNELLLKNRTNIPNVLRHTYYDPILKDGGILYRYAMRQLKGKDYKKRAIEVAEEIQSDCYLIEALHGWPNIVCASFDHLCDEIIELIDKEPQSARTVTPTGKDGSA